MFSSNRFDRQSINSSKRTIIISISALCLVIFAYRIRTIIIERTDQALVSNALSKIEAYYTLGEIDQAYLSTINYTDISFSAEELNIPPTKMQSILDSHFRDYTPYTIILTINNSSDIDIIHSELILKKNEYALRYNWECPLPKAYVDKHCIMNYTYHILIRNEYVPALLNGDMSAYLPFSLVLYFPRGEGVIHVDSL